MTQIELSQFKQTNLRAVLERANELLYALGAMTHSHELQENIVTELMNKCETGDTWERAALSLVAVELFERIVREDDSSVEKFPEGWAGGIYVGAKE